jgi:DNA-binding MarR family transcriptional regulator
MGWTAQKTAAELLNILPGLNRLIASHWRLMAEEEATLMQVKVLAQLIEHPISVSELARRRKVSLQSASAQIQRLVERGWVARTADPADRRRSLLQITSEGLAQAQTTENRITEHLAKYLDELAPEEMEAAQVFLAALHRIFVAHVMADKTKCEPK